MKLVFVSAALPTSHVEAFLLAELLEVSRHGHRVVVVPVRPRGAVVHAEARHLTARVLPLLSVEIAGAAARETLRSPFAVARALRDVVVGSRSPRVLAKNLAVLPKALWLARVARVEGIDHIHACFASTSATVACIASALSGVPWSFSAHRWDITEDNLVAAKAASAAFARAIDARGARTLRALAGAHADKVCTLHVGVELGGEPRSRASVPLRVLIASRLVELKGHRVALDALARCAAVELDIAGEGPLRADLEADARALGVAPRVRFLGPLDHHQLLTDLRAGRWDTAVLPSLETASDWEGIPVFLIEAMAAGVPVIATRTGGIPELLEGGAGLLVPQSDPVALASAIAKLQRDPDLRRQLAAAGRARVAADYDVARVVAALLERVARNRA